MNNHPKKTSNVTKRPIEEAKKQEYYTLKNSFKNITKIVIPSNLQVGLKSDLFNSTISGSIYVTRQGLSYLVAGSNIDIVSGSNGQVTISATAGSEGSAGPATPDASFTRSVIPVNTDDTGGALDDGNDLADADISQQAFTKIDVNAGVTNVTFAGHNASGDPASNNYKIVSANVVATTDNGTALSVTNDAGAENDLAYNLTCANASATRLKLAVSSDSSDAKLRVSYLAEHEDGSSTDFNSVLVDVPIKVTSAAGTQTITRSFTVQKIKKGTTGDTGSTGSGGSNGNDTPDVSLTRTVVTIGTDPTGGAFDDGGDLSDADIYIQVTEGLFNIIYDHPFYIPNASGLNVEYEFIPESPINLTSFLSIHYIDLWDYDTLSDDDAISTLSFIPYESSGGFPTTITRTNSDGTFECDIAFEYTW